MGNLDRLDRLDWQSVEDALAAFREVLDVSGKSPLPLRDLKGRFRSHVRFASPTRLAEGADALLAAVDRTVLSSAEKAEIAALRHSPDGERILTRQWLALQRAG